MQKIVLVCLSIILTSLIHPVEAHEASQSLEKRVGPYLINVGYDSEAENPIATETNGFHFGLFTYPENDVVEFDNVEIKVLNQENLIVFQARLKRPREGLTEVAYPFPKAGTYKMNVSFNNENRKIAEGEFKFEVEEAYENHSPVAQAPSSNFFYGVLAGGSIMLILTILYKSVLQNRTSK